MEDDKIELRPPSPQQVARRALILSAVVCRGAIDGGKGDADAESLPARINAWLKRSRLVGHLEPWEAELVRTCVGELGQERVYRATWAVEGLAVLAWALGRSELPRHDQRVDPYATAEAVGFLGDDAEEFVAAAELRSAEELRDCRELLYAVHCRMRDFLRHRTTQDFATWIEPEWLDVLKLDRARLIAGGDLAFGGKPISAVTADAVQKCEWVVQEHHRATIWLVGEEYPSYWNWGVDT